MVVFENNELKVIAEDGIPVVTIRFVGTAANEDAAFLEE